MVFTVDSSGSSAGVTSDHVAPASRDSHTRPSSVPTHNNDASTGDSARAKIVQYTSAPDVSLVIGPPDAFSLSGSARVRSSDTASQLCPPSRERKTRSPHAYNTDG